MVQAVGAKLCFVALMCLLTTRPVDCQEGITDLPSNTNHPVSTNSSDNESDEYQLILELLRRYNNNRVLSRPVRNARDIVLVDFNLHLQQIVALNEKSQAITTQLWKHYHWKDEYLQWDPAEYGGLEQVRLPSDKIWTPDIALYNSLAEDSFQPDEYKVSLVVFYTGVVRWIPLVIYRSACSIRIDNFPFDTQTCKFKFGSWVYSVDKLHLVVNVTQGFDLSNYLYNSLWSISRNVASTNKHRYGCCSEFYGDATFELTLHRNSGFHTHVLLVPVTMAASLIPLIFWIPPRRPDRTSLCLSLFGTFCFLLLVVAGLTPPSATNSRIGAFCCLSIIATTVASILSAAVVNIVFSQKALPGWQRTICVRWLSRLLCICPPNGQSRNKRENVRKPPEEITMSSPGDEEELKSHQSKSESHDSQGELKQVARDRDTVAAVLDRLFFIIFIFLILFLFLFIFPFPFRS